MANLDPWDGFLLAAGAYVAVMALVRLMRAHRKKVTDELYEQFRAEQYRNRGKKTSADKPNSEAA
jgi:hypothetical protein